MGVGKVSQLTLVVADADVDGDVVCGELLAGGVGSSRTRPGTHGGCFQIVMGVESDGINE